MARTTIDIDDPVLTDLKRLQKKSDKSLGQLVSELLASALAAKKKPQPPPPFRWVSRKMGVPQVDLADKDAVQAILDRELVELIGR
jgi:hypothetical protein